jgi:RNA ligase (TIGR02306 family)
LFGIKPAKSSDDFPSHLVPKTDETRVQNMGVQLERRTGEAVYITEKLEGSSATFIYRGGGNWFSKLFGKGYSFLVCSRNKIVYDIRKGNKPAHYLMQVEIKYNIEQQLRKLNRNLALQGEIIGPKIQGNIYKLNEPDFRLFLIYDLDKRAYVPYVEFISLAQTLGISTVPVLDDRATIINSIKYYVELSKGKSKLHDSILREGIVIRSLTDNFSFKSINPEYLLARE